MDILDFMNFCMTFPLSEETTPFDHDILVYKVAGKMFVFTSIKDFTWICLKCSPDRVIELRERYPEIGKARSMNPNHWVTVRLGGDLPAAFIRALITDSYKLVVAGMPSTKRQAVLEQIRLSGWEAE